jgi:hypothetical protein
VFSTFTMGQTDFRTQAASITEKMVSQYNLTTEQAAQMQKIQERKLNNDMNIAKYKNTDIEKYYKKRKSNMDGTSLSINKMLDNEQRQKYRQAQSVVRKQLADITIAKVKQGMKHDQAYNMALDEIGY